MAKYKFKSAQGSDGDPLIQLVEGQVGVVNCLLIAQEKDLLYFNLKKHKNYYGVVDVTAFMESSFPPKRLLHLDGGTLRNLSQSAKIPLKEIIEIAEIERANWRDIIKYARTKGFYQ